MRGKLWILGKSRELLLSLLFVLSNCFRARRVIAELLVLQFQLEQLSLKPLHYRYPLHI